ncbi:MAG: F0F1 ATP synthase subunit A [Polyangiaceae bacterium]
MSRAGAKGARPELPMPEHTSFFSYLIAMFPALGQNMHALGHTVFGKPVDAHKVEPLVASAFVVLLVILLASMTRKEIENHDKAVVPDDKLSLRTFMEVFIGAFYNTVKDVMGAKKAKRYFPLIGTLALFIFFSNVLGMIPGFSPPTSSWNITLACALIVFVAFNYWGIKENGAGYFKHLAGPVWYLAPLIFVIEVMSLIVRPITLSVRLMLNMAVDHLLLTIFLGLFMFLLPIPVMILGTLVVLVQTYVFCLLTSIYIALATEHEDHGEGHAHGHDHAHGDGHKAHA